ncbi:lycopene cyclase family protein [Anaerolinea thermophila]|uniref:Lycopene cyclase n=1 Tax=Anaerolinea thermophila (strain DSM 14523 / JCM 11388 / NBRC 100420 / UNI-1) TaxID=926569 RepID=E8N507_ANATU|nr:lycopene cyclase family protein [Anaerolinea thermophila]BAJ63521.1 putative lycopene cyclase [Anaerolinea thermophila UNI-1]
MKKYTFIILGAGAAGLSLAYYLVHSKLRDQSILLIDREEKNRNDRTWCFWSSRDEVFSSIFYRSWEKIGFIHEEWQKVIPLGEYRYNMIRGIDFYQEVRQTLRARLNVDWITAPVTQIIDTPEFALVAAGGKTYQAEWVFDSRFDPNLIEKKPERYHYLLQHFLGWEIETLQPTWDSSIPILFDFRVSQETGFQFFYTLPFNENRALVEYTFFTPTLLSDEEYQRGLETYLKNVLRLDTYEIHDVEKGVIPMTDHPLPRRGGRRVMNIGTRGGRVKPSSGYAFARILRDSREIVRSLEKYGTPFRVPASPRRYAWYDRLLLQILYRQPQTGKAIFTALFKNNPPQRIFRFLDEEGSLLENIRLIASLPPVPFLKALLQVNFLRKI